MVAVFCAKTVPGLPFTSIEAESVNPVSSNNVAVPVPPAVDFDIITSPTR